jgi:hypothetical protein
VIMQSRRCWAATLMSGTANLAPGGFGCVALHDQVGL